MTPGSLQLVAVLGRGIVGTDEPLATADDLGLTRGDGCFDAMRVLVEQDAARVDHRDAHLARFARSCAALDLAPPDLAAWNALIDEAVAGWHVPGEAALKLVATRGPEHDPAAGPTCFLTITPVPPSCGPLDVVTLSRGVPSDAYADAPWLLGGVKTLAYAVNVAARREAERRGAGDVLFTSTDGFCLEGPTSALVVAVGDELVTTPTGGTGILASCTAAAIADAAGAAGVRFGHRLLRPAELTTARAAWLVSAVRGVCLIASLDGVPLARDAELSQRLMRWAGFGDRVRPASPASRR